MRLKHLSLFITAVFLFSLMAAPLLPQRAAAQSERLNVVATYSVLGDVVSQVAGDAADVDVLMPLGADPHNYEASGSDIVLLEQADAVFVNGAGFEESLLDLLASDTINSVVASNCVYIWEFGAADHDHGDEHDHEEGDDHGDEDHGDEDHGDEDHGDEDHGDEDHGDDHGDEDHGDEDHGDDDHGDEDHGDEDHGDEDHGDEDHGDEDHGDEDHGDEDHGDEDHGDEDHGDEDHGDEDHGDEDHGDEDMSAMASLCEAHYSELASVLGGELPAYFARSMGPLYSLPQCAAGHSHDDDDHEEGEHDEDHDDEHEHEDGEHEHGEGSCDPHVWMDPHSGMLWALMVRDTLSELDPANAATYAANTDAYLGQLAALSSEVFALIDSIPQENRVLITNHSSFGYLANPTGFEVVRAVIPGGSTAAEPSAQELVELAELVEDEGVPAVFSENTVSNDLAARIADTTGAELVQLFTGSLSDADGPAPTYLDYLRFNYTTIATALNGE